MGMGDHGAARPPRIDIEIANRTIKIITVRNKGRLLIHNKDYNATG
jgi:hypothetical protein